MRFFLSFYHNPTTAREIETKERTLHSLEATDFISPFIEVLFKVEGWPVIASTSLSKSGVPRPVT